MNVSIDRDQCISCGACYGECPQVFEENGDDSWSQITEPYRRAGDIAAGEVPPELESCARNAADVCPVSIIHAG
jgi:ferredoxin